MTNIDGSYKYVCAICEQIFCDLSTKLDHVHGKHKEGEGAKKIVKLFPCENCGLNLQRKTIYFITWKHTVTGSREQSVLLKNTNVAFVIPSSL